METEQSVLSTCWCPCLWSFFSFLSERSSLCSPGWPGTYCVDQASFVFDGAGIQAGATAASLNHDTFFYARIKLRCLLWRVS